METLRIGRPPKLSSRMHVHWAVRAAWSMTLVCAVGVVALVALLMTVDAIR